MKAFLVKCVCIFLGVLGHFFIEYAFMEKDPRGIQKSTREPPTPRGVVELRPLQISPLDEKCMGGPTKIRMRFPAILMYL